MELDNVTPQVGREGGRKGGREARELDNVTPQVGREGGREGGMQRMFMVEFDNLPYHTPPSLPPSLPSENRANLP